MPNSISRRALLAAGIGAAAGLSRAAQDDPLLSEDPNLFLLSRLCYTTHTNSQDRWDINPAADDKFLEYVGQKTTIKVSKKSWMERSVGLEDLRRAYETPDSRSKVFQLPFLFMTGLSAFNLQPQEAATLGEYFRRGGFLYADDCATSGKHFYQAFVTQITKAMPDLKMTVMPHDHAIYNCFYRFENGAPRTQGPPGFPDMGLFWKNRLIAFLTSGDLHCGWAGHFLSGGKMTPEKAEPCSKMGVNIVIYALTH